MQNRSTFEKFLWTLQSLKLLQRQNAPLMGTVELADMPSYHFQRTAAEGCDLQSFEIASIFH